MEDLEVRFEKHLEDCRIVDKERAQEEKERFKADKDVFQELLSLRTSIETLPLLLKNTFITKDDFNENNCERRFDVFMKKHNKELIKQGNSIMSFVRNLGWVISGGLTIGIVFVKFFA
jgi:uncharacterized Fe-S cluster-containing protein